MWASRLEDLLDEHDLWVDANGDVPGAPKETKKAYNMIVKHVADSMYELFKDVVGKSATKAWKFLCEICVTSDVSAKVSAIQSFIDFRYNLTDMLANKTALLKCERALIAAYSQKRQIDISSLTLMFGLLTLPLAYQTLRTTLEETATDASPLTIQSMFDSLIREESNIRSLANRADSQGHDDGQHTAFTAAGVVCTNRWHRDVKTCWTCSPKSRPTCVPCRDSGVSKWFHKTGSDGCQARGFRKPTTANRAVSFTIDSGATDTILSNKQNVSNYIPLSHPIRTANGDFMIATGTGDITAGPILLKEVLVCPSVTENLLSVSKLGDQGLDVLFSGGKVSIGTNGLLGSTVLAGYRRGGSYFLDFPLDSQALSATTADDLHLRLNHLNARDMGKLSSKGMLSDLPKLTTNILHPCDGCSIGKARKGTPPSSTYHRASRPGELIHSDVCGPITPISKSGYRFALTLIDDFSRYTVVYLLIAKSEVPARFMEFDAIVFNKFGRHTTIIRSDNGGEYKNGRFAEYCRVHGIEQQFTTPYSSNQNGVAERMHLTLFNKIRATLVSSKMNAIYWDELMMNVAYTGNLSPTSANTSETPSELYHGVKPSAAHLQKFGDRCVAVTTQYQRAKSGASKLADRGVRCTFLGYSSSSKSYLLLADDGKIVISRYEDVSFMSEQVIATPIESVVETTASTPIVEVLHSDVDMPELLPQSDDSDTGFESALSDLDEGRHDLDLATPLLSTLTTSTSGVDQPSVIVETDSEADRLPNPPTGMFDTAPGRLKDILAPPAHSKRISKPTKHYGAHRASTSPIADLAVASALDLLPLLDFIWYRLPPSSAALSVSGTTLPIKYTDIEMLVDREDWYRAADAEIATLIENGTWELVPLPGGREPVKSKWVFRIKKDTDGSIIKYKARLCACGYSQKEGIDYKEIYAPVVRSESLRLVLATVASRDMHVHQMDVVTAFLNGELKETVFMKQPAGYVDPARPNDVCRLHRSLYGLKQAPRVWHQTIDPFLKSLGFNSLTADPCVYVRWNGEVLSIITLYVDDLTIASDDLAVVLDVKAKLGSRFKMTDEGELTYILGIKVRRDRANKAIYISNETKIDEILSDYNMATSIPADTPMDAITISNANCPSPNSPEALAMVSVPYRECVGRLIYLMRTTRPDIAFAVSVVSRFLHNPGHLHWNAVKRILRYLRGTKGFELKISPLDLSSQIAACDRSSPLEGPARLSGNVDSDWAGDDDTMKSTSGYGFFLGASLISWSSKAQLQTATSSTHAEYAAAYQATTEGVWTRSFLKAAGLLAIAPTTLYCDNEAAIKIAKLHMVTPRSKHFDTKLHYVREQVEAGALSLQFCAGSDNVADIFTKPLGRLKFRRFRDLLGVGAAD